MTPIHPESTPATPEPAAAAAPPEPTPARRRRVGRPVILVAAALLLGAGVGTAGRLVGSDRSAAEPEPELTDPGPPPPPVSGPEQVDAAIRAGNFAAGLAACRELPRTAFGGHEQPLAYREGLCLEGLGKTAEAAAAYARAAEGYATPGVWGWAVLGQARCAAAAGDLAAAGRAISRVALQSGANHDLLDECLHARGRLAVAGLKVVQSPDPLNIDTLAWSQAGDDLAGSAGRLLPPAHPPGQTDPPAAVTVFRRWRNPGRILVSGHVREGAAADVIRAVAAAIGVTVRIDPEAEGRLPAAGVGMDVVTAPHAEILTALTEPYGAEWVIAGGELRVGPAVPTGRGDAEAALRRALQYAPGH
ncbi:MAG TPA: hypothetical protein VH092_08150, partial [Urbifossiella sp.]|nr:hypothetical protein [Urbifossiella sp.]